METENRTDEELIAQKAKLINHVIKLKSEIERYNAKLSNFKDSDNFEKKIEIKIDELNQDIEENQLKVNELGKFWQQVKNSKSEIEQQTNDLQIQMEFL